MSEAVSNKGILSVDDLSFRIKEAIESYPGMGKIAVHGEIVDLKRHSSGHCYFTLSGRESRIAGVLFRSDAAGVVKWPRPGDEVVVGGRVSSYPQRGIYQLYARRLFPLGKGAISRAKEELRAKLSKEGIFAPERKRPIPPYPERVLCITSATGAAFRDVVKVMGTRNPSVELVLIPATVQGVDGPDEIAEAFAKVPSFLPADAVLLVRGGGSRGDLNPFDDETVVRSISSCPVPVVVGVGHQVDFTLSDMAADMRCATPSEAAEAVVPDRTYLYSLLSNGKNRLKKAMEREIDRLATRVVDRETLLTRLVAGDIDRLKKDVDGLSRRAVSATEKTVVSEIGRLAGLSAALDGASPLRILGKGYVSCRDETGTPVSSVKSMAPGKKISLDFLDGRAYCRVESSCVLKRS
ncbi:exodeoxyribonuclease VII, large subunit [Dethiosulfovibrio peptidovorans DSM 11002]|uniref:Exodeoxyribonuclease 7 large subunit n=1 Tax=Dethiosulfovibrio peptidovorans DSM 11002 TaxID=469381 RepID=D2Z420_9BACT|nr:exodeoxyribonuclease VII large subunit [Dethiosulfovibrio peptidovorans]EFC92281.1 exodeoxyribonuclease VII, large subunit [Dethiosulfovibrio peptidovorans DSM 11002]